MTDYIPWLYNVIKSFKVRLSPPKKNFGTCFIESSLKIMKNAFCFILKAFFIPKIFKFSSWIFGRVEKRLD